MTLIQKLNTRHTKQNWKKIPDVTSFLKKTKLTEIGNKIPDVSNLSTTNALMAVENKIPSISNLVKKRTMT